MCCYIKNGGFGFTLTTIWRAAAVRGMHPLIGTIILGGTKERLSGESTIFSSYSPAQSFFSACSLSLSRLILSANVVGSKDNSVILHTSSASTVQTGGRGGGSCRLKSFGSAVDHSASVRKIGGGAVLCADHLGEHLDLRRKGATEGQSQRENRRKTEEEEGAGVDS